MHKAIVYSVPGTGTRFCKKFMEDVLGYKTTGRKGKLNMHGADPVYCAIHSSKINFDKFMKKYPGAKLITPIRNPYLSFISSYSKLLSKSTLPEKEAAMITNWNYLIERTKQYPTVYVPIDCLETDRENHLRYVAQHLGAESQNAALVEYAKEWTVVGSKSDSKMKQEYLEQGTILGTKPTFLDFAVEWCERKQNERRT